jgi:hypothetical protein
MEFITTKKKLVKTKIKQSNYDLLLKMLLLFFLMISFINAKSQTTNGITVNGTILEDGTNKPLSYATVALLTQKDSALVSGAISTANGSFVLKNVPAGSFKLKITFIGYNTLRTKVNIQKASSPLNLGKFILSVEKNMMKEVVITGTMPVQVKKDTIEYNADMFKTEKNAVVEDMLKKLPGVDVDASGNIKAQGNTVSRVFVDGKQFFGNDPLIATQNLPADMIAKVQIIDKKSDQAEFTKIDDGDIEKVINIVTRQGYKHGNFGKLSLGYGNNDRYDDGLMFNNFDGERQFSLLGMLNDVNIQRFTLDASNSLLNRRQSTLGSARSGRMGGGGGGSRGGFIAMSPAARGMSASGISTTGAGGLNFHDKFGKNLELTTSYFYNNTDNKNNQSSITQTLNADSSIFKHDTTYSHTNNSNHRVNMELDYQIDSMNSIIFKPNISYAINNSDRSSSSITNGQSGYRLNESNASSSSSGTSLNSSNTLLYKLRFKKPRRTFSINFGNTITSGNTDSYTKSLLTIYNTSKIPGSSNTPVVTNSDLYYDGKTSGTGYNARFSYTEPLSKYKSLELNYYYSVSNNTSTRKAYDYNPVTGLYDKPDTVFSNKFENTYIDQRYGITIQTQKNKLMYSYGLGFETAQITSKTHIKDTLFNRSLTSVNFSPTATLNYSFTNRTKLNMQYRGSTNQPTIDQLQPVVTNPNSLTQSIGNQGLKSSFTNDFNMNYNNVNVKTFSNYFFNFQYSNVLNAISNYYIYGPNNEELIMPVNVKGSYDASASTGLGIPFSQNKYVLNTSGSFTWNNDVSYIKNSPTSLTINTPVDFVGANKNTTRTLSLGYNLMGTLNTKLMMATLAGRINYNRAWQSIQTNTNSIYTSYNIYGDIKLTLPAGFLLSTDCQYNVNSGFSGNLNKPYALWNAGASKDVFKNKKGQIKFQILDILKQNQNIKRTYSGNNIIDTKSTGLTQYFMFSFVYNFNTFKNMGGVNPDAMRRFGPDGGGGGYNRRGMN